jgi:RecA-family ATPase
MALQIAHAIASGGQVFNQAVEQGEVLYLAMEDTRQRMQDRMIKQGFSQAAARNMVIITKAEGFSTILQGGAERIRAMLGMGDFRLVVIDTLGRLSGRAADNKDYGAMTDVLDPLQQIAVDFNLAVLVLDHHRKGAKFDADTIDDIIGSTSKAGVADTIMGMFGVPGKPVVELKIVGRDIEEIEYHLERDYVTLSWQLSETDPDGLSEREREIVEAIREIGPCSCPDLARYIGRDYGNTNKRLLPLVTRTLVLKTGERGNYTYALPSRKEAL